MFKTIPQKLWESGFNTHSKPVGNGESTLKYLANYVYKTAISNNRIVSLENGKVTFNYKDSKTNKTKFVKAYSRKWSFYSDNRTVSKSDVFSRNSSCEYNLFTNKHQIICSDNI